MQKETMSQAQTGKKKRCRWPRAVGAGARSCEQLNQKEHQARRGLATALRCTGLTHTAVRASKPLLSILPKRVQIRPRGQHFKLEQ